MKRLSTSQVPDVTRQLVRMQGGKCGVCGLPFTKRDGPVCDHDHDTGIIRGAIHRSCNGAEGRVKSKAKMGHTGVAPADFIIGLGKYLEKHKKPQTKLIYPSHRTDEEKRLERNRKARIRRQLKKKR